MFLVVDEMTDILEHFGKKLKQQKEDSWNSVNQQKQSRSLLDRNSWWVWAIYSLFNSSIYWQKASMNAKNKFEMLKEESNKLKHKIGEKELLMISLMGQAKKRARKMWQTEL